MLGNRGEKIREMYFRTLDETIGAMRSADNLGFAYTVESYVQLTGEDQGEGEWKLTLYDFWDVPQNSKQ